MTPLCKEAQIQGLTGWKAKPFTRADFDSNLVNILLEWLRRKIRSGRDPSNNPLVHCGAPVKDRQRLETRTGDDCKSSVESVNTVELTVHTTTSFDQPIRIPEQFS